jgi:DNA-directed RNA polymerase specialized sigma24 family protein
MILGDRVLLEADGRQRRIRANLGHSPIQWLARRRDAQGRPFLTPAEAAAGERLAHEAEIALSGPSLTMRWDALPRAGGGSAARVEPGDRALNAAGRVRRALAACPPETRAVLDHICIRGQTLQLAEQACGMRRRTGREALRRGLTALARHYRVG